MSLLFRKYFPCYNSTFKLKIRIKAWQELTLRSNLLSLFGNVFLTKSRRLFCIFKWMFNLFPFNSSERIGKTNANGLLLTEAKYINLSLHYLEQVILIRQRIEEVDLNLTHFNLTKGYSCSWRKKSISCTLSQLNDDIGAARQLGRQLYDNYDRYVFRWKT